VSNRLKELGDETLVFLVTFSQPDFVESYNSEHSLAYEVLMDPARDAYRSYGLGRGSLSRIWGIRSARRYLQLIRADGIGGLRRPVEDTRQLGGDFIVGPDGVLTYGFWGEGPDDRPSVDELIDAVGSI